MTYPKVYIIILNSNGWWDIIGYLEPLQRITYSAYQIIVVGNVSTHDSMKKIKAWARGEIPVVSKFLEYNPTTKPIQWIEYDCRIAEAGAIPDEKAKIQMLPPYKAPEEKIKALEICRSKFKDLQAIVFGPGYKPRHLPSWIQYMANVIEEKLVQIYNWSSIFLSFSLAEVFAFPPAEAMACGCAVVATDSGGIREYAEHGKTTLLSPPGYPKALAQNLLCILENDDLRIQLAKAGHERIKHFTWERSTDLLEKLLLQHLKNS